MFRLKYVLIIKICLGIKIFVAGGDSSNCDDGGDRRKLESEILHVFQSKSQNRFNEITLIWSETVLPFPGFDVFGGTVQTKVVVGNGKSVLEYNLEENCWNVLHLQLQQHLHQLAYRA